MATDEGKRTSETTELRRKISIGFFFLLSVVYNTMPDIIQKESITLHCINLKCVTALSFPNKAKEARLTADLTIPSTRRAAIFSLTDEPQITALRNTHFLAHWLSKLRLYSGPIKRPSLTAHSGEKGEWQFSLSWHKVQFYLHWLYLLFADVR